jgi:hypothetical protein
MTRRRHFPTTIRVAQPQRHAYIETPLQFMGLGDPTES